MKPLYIFDIDGTLADCSHRVHMLDSEDDDKWLRFYDACDGDSPIMAVIETLNRLSRVCDVWFFTGRTESVRSKTVEWLECNTRFSILDFKNPILTMRPDGDYTPDWKLKELWLKSMLDIDRNRLIGVFDDRNSVVDMWRRNCVTCFQVADGDF